LRNGCKIIGLLLHLKKVDKVAVLVNLQSVLTMSSDKKNLQEKIDDLRQSTKVFKEKTKILKEKQQAVKKPKT